MLAGWRALTSTASSWPRNGSSSEMSDNYDDRGAVGTRVVESGPTRSSRPAAAVASVATPPAISVPVLELAARMPSPAGTSPPDTMLALARASEEIEYYGRSGLPLHPPA